MDAERVFDPGVIISDVLAELMKMTGPPPAAMFWVVSINPDGFYTVSGGAKSMLPPMLQSAIQAIQDVVHNHPEVNLVSDTKVG